MESRSSLGEIDGGKKTRAKTEPGRTRVNARIIARNTNRERNVIDESSDLWFALGFSLLVFRGDPHAREEISRGKGKMKKRRKIDR